MKSFKKFLCAVCALISLFALALPFSGCSYSENFTPLYDENGVLYGYEISYSGYLNGLKGDFTVPESYGEGEDAAPVVRIADNGFINCGLSSVTIPAAVKEMGVAAFAYCSSLKKVEIAAGGITEIPQSAFAYCDNLADISLPEGVDIIGLYAFKECRNLTALTLPSTVTEIRNSAFENCYALESVSFPEGLLTIGARAYASSGLKEVVLPDSLTDREIIDADGEKFKLNGLGISAFHSCTSLERAALGKGISEVSAGAFGYCTALREIYIPATVKKICGPYYIDGDWYCGHAFHHDGALTDVYFGGSAEEWGALLSASEMEKATLQREVYDNSALESAVKHYGESGLPA